MSPPGNPIRPHPFGVKIIQGEEIVNSSAKIQFQVNRSIFVREMNHYVFAVVWQNSNVLNVHGNGSKIS